MDNGLAVELEFIADANLNETDAKERFYSGMRHLTTTKDLPLPSSLAFVAAASLVAHAVWLARDENDELLIVDREALRIPSAFSFVVHNDLLWHGLGIDDLLMFYPMRFLKVLRRVDDDCYVPIAVYNFSAYLAVKFVKGRLEGVSYIWVDDPNIEFLSNSIQGAFLALCDPVVRRRLLYKSS